MLTGGIQMIVVAGFWVSFALIGYAGLILLQKYKRATSLTTFVAVSPLLARFFFWMVAGFVAIAPFIIIGFACSLPIRYLVVLYVVLLLVGIGISGLQLWRWWQQKPKITIRPTQMLVVMLLVVGALAIDYGVSHMVGAYIANGNDAYVHMGKIEQLSQGNLTLNDPYFAGVIESRYHVNLVTSLNALGVRLTNISTVDFWMQSAAFFRLLCWLSVFAVAWYFAPIKNRRMFAAFATIVAIVLFSFNFAAANYPNVLVLAWLSVWLIGLSRYIVGKDPWLLLAGALLAGMTHPVYAAGAAGFMLLFMLGIIIGQRSWFTKERWIVLAGTFVMLIVPTVITLLYPNRLSDATLAFGNIPTVTIAGETILKPTLPSAGAALMLAALAIIGYIFIIAKRPSRVEKIMLGLLVVYFALLAYNPLVSLVVGEQLPPWLIDRFRTINRLSAVAVSAGVIASVSLVRNRHIQRRRLIQAFIVVICLIPIGLASMQQVRQYRQTKEENQHQLTLMHSIQTLKPFIAGQRVFALPGDSFTLPAIMTLSVIAMPETNASPVANMALRVSCSQELAKSLDANALATAGVTRVMVGAWDPVLMQLAKSKPYLHQIGGNGNYIIFEFTKPVEHRTVMVCDIPYGQ